MPDEPSTEADSYLDAPAQTESWWQRRGTGVVFATAAFVFALAGLISLAYIPRAILAEWFPDATDDVRAASLWPAAQVVLFALGGCIAIAGIALSGARHGEELRAADRDRERARIQERMYQLDRHKERNRIQEASTQRLAEQEAALRTRLVTAVELLSSDLAAAKRMTGLYVLAGLVDDWLARRNLTEAQVCVDVICGYLRSRPDTTDGSISSAEVLVRSAGFEVIRSHLLKLEDRNRAAWAGLTFNLAGCKVDFSVNLTRIHLAAGTTVNLERAVVVEGGRLLLMGAECTNNALLILNGMRISDGGELDLQEAQLRGGARILCSDLTVERNGVASFARVNLSDDSEIIIGGATITTGGALRASGLRARQRAKLTVNRAIVRDGGNFFAVRIETSDDTYVSFGSLKVGDGGQVNLAYLTITKNGLVSFTKPKIQAGGRLNLSHWSIDSARGVVFSDAIIESSARATFGSATIKTGTLELSFKVLERGGKFIIDGVRLLPGAELYAQGANSDPTGRVWINAELLTDPGAFFLGKVSPEGGEVVV